MFKVCMLFIIGASFSLCDEHGVKMRLTTKGMDYVVKVGIDIMEKDLKKMKISKTGKFENGQYNITNLSINHVNFGSHLLKPIKGIGIKGTVSDIDIEASTNLSFTYNYWFSFSDHTSFEVKASGIDFTIVLDIGRSDGGHPSISVLNCEANVGEIDLKFDGGLSFLYNIISPLMESEIKVTLKETLCEMAKKEIGTKAKEELESFPVVRKIDSFAEIDYRLTEAPIFTDSYMDALLKGEFKHSESPKESTITIPPMLTNSDHSKMVYFWISDYTLNTAGEVYHEANKLQVSIDGNDDKTPQEFKSLLRTNKFAMIFPKILLDHANEAMGVHVYSYKAPYVNITEKEANFHLFAKAKFTDKSNNDLFTFKFHIKAGATLGVRRTNITAKIDYFTYDASVLHSIYGQPIISVDNEFVEILVGSLIIKTGNEYISQGFPLPKVSDVTFENFDVHLMKDAIRIGTDLKRIER